MSKKCQRCKKSDVRRGYRFCERCIGVTIKEMQESGYLTHVPTDIGPRPRTRDQMEDQRETRHGLAD